MCVYILHRLTQNEFVILCNHIVNHNYPPAILLDHMFLHCPVFFQQHFIQDVDLVETNKSTWIDAQCKYIQIYHLWNRWSLCTFLSPSVDHFSSSLKPEVKCFPSYSVWAAKSRYSLFIFILHALWGTETRMSGLSGRKTEGCQGVARLLTLCLLFSAVSAVTLFSYLLPSMAVLLLRTLTSAVEKWFVWEVDQKIKVGKKC